MIARFALIGLLTVLGGLVAATQARADTSSRDRATCTTTEIGPPAIEACTALIRAGDTRKAQLAGYYFTRALHYEDAGAYDHAFADLNSAILIHPFTDAYLNRGICFMARGKWNLAIADSIV